MADYLVSGAGSSEVNLTYVENGTAYNIPKYEVVSGGETYRLYWDINETWFILGVGADTYYYYSSVVSDTPPETGWTVLEGTSPVPTVILEGGGGDDTPASNGMMLLW